MLKCIAGILGFFGCNTTETPEDQKLVLFFVPGILLANTLVNFYCKTKKEIPYIAELPTSLKLGYFLPCSNIPIVDSRILLKDKPDYVLILAWHLWQPIVKKWKNIQKCNLISQHIMNY